MHNIICDMIRENDPSHARCTFNVRLKLQVCSLLRSLFQVHSVFLYKVMDADHKCVHSSLLRSLFQVHSVFLYKVMDADHKCVLYCAVCFKYIVCSFTKLWMLITSVFSIAQFVSST